MKRTLTALTVAASLIASGGLAFDMNVTQEEHNRLLGKPMVGDLAVGVKGLLNSYGFGCVKNDKVYLNSSTDLDTKTLSVIPYYEIIRQADGGFTATYGPSESGDKDLPSLPNVKCDDVAESHSENTYYPINSINGFTDWRSFLIDLINQGYE